jgi:hypothetical protein
MGGTRAEERAKERKKRRKERECGTQQDSRIHRRDTSGKKEQKKGRRDKKERECGTVPRRLFFAAQQRIAITWKPN